MERYMATFAFSILGLAWIGWLCAGWLGGGGGKAGTGADK